MNEDPKRLLEIIVTVFNESQTIHEFFRRFTNSLSNLEFPNWKISLTLVDDGSSDSTANELEVLTKRKYNFDITVLTLSRNFGHQQAVWAGIEHSSQQSCVLVMDADLQDPPERIADFLRELENFDVVIAQRISRQDSFTKRFFASIF